MAGVIKYWKSKVMLVKAETTAGTDSVPTGALDAVKVSDLTIAVNADEVSSAVDGASFQNDDIDFTNKTFTMIKPDAVENGHIGAILEKINSNGFTIKAMEMTQLSRRDAEEFYEIHKERPFFGELVEYMTSGPIVAAILEKDNAVADFRTLIGATNPDEAAEGTIRKLYATSIAANAVHGSDSDENAAIEGNFFFNQRNRY